MKGKVGQKVKVVQNNPISGDLGGMFRCLDQMFVERCALMLALGWSPGVENCEQ